MPVYETEAPGVYIEEVATEPAIAGVSTSITAFFGVVADDVPMPPKADETNANATYTVAPLNTWVLVTSFADFTQNFGMVDAKNRDLALSVKGYFANGGSLAYVVRVESLVFPTDAGKLAAFNAVLQALEANDQVSLIVAPGCLDKPFQEALIAHCDLLKDRFVILDGKRVATVNMAAIEVATTRSDYAAIYYPWIEVAGLKGADNTNYLPPSGLVAGVFARVDSQRGVHKAPANERIFGALGLEHVTSDSEQKNVNRHGINVIRSFQGNIKIWGARTRGVRGDGDIVYINVRRLMIFVAKSIDTGTQWVVFEPNAVPLWMQIKRSVSGFLFQLWKDGALFGIKQEQAFYVVCDETTNPAASRDLGIVTTEIGIAPVRPAEFVVFRIAQYPEIPAAS